MDKTYAGYLSDISGYKLSAGFGLVTHFYNVKNNKVPGNAVKLCTVADYVVMKLCNKEKPLTDFSNAAGLGFFDIRDLGFNTQVLDDAGIDASILPETVKSPQAEGFYRGIPVFTAIGDNQAGFLGSVRDIDTSIHMMVGTSSQISVYCEELINIECLDTRPFPGGGYLIVGAALCGGFSLDMLKAFFDQAIKFFYNPDDSCDFYGKMSMADYSGCSCDLPQVKTLFAGTRLDPGTRGEISNISTSNFTPENLIKGFNKGICDELYSFYETLPGTIKKDKVNLVGSGNGIKKNKLLRRVIEEKFQKKLLLTPYQEESAFGACISAIAGSHFIDGYKNFDWRVNL
jgi:sedoheptulokinase